MAKQRELKTRADGVKQHYNTGTSVTSNADARAAFNPRPAKKEEPVEEVVDGIENIGGQGAWMDMDYESFAAAEEAGRALLKAEAAYEDTDYGSEEEKRAKHEVDACRVAYEFAVEAVADEVFTDWAGDSAYARESGTVVVAGPRFSESVGDELMEHLRQEVADEAEDEDDQEKRPGILDMILAEPGGRRAQGLPSDIPENDPILDPNSSQYNEAAARVYGPNRWVVNADGDYSRASDLDEDGFLIDRGD